MSDSSFERDRLAQRVFELADAELSGTATVEQSSELAHLVMTEPRARELYVAFMHDTASLNGWADQAQLPFNPDNFIDTQLIQHLPTQPRPQIPSTWLRFAAAAAIVLVVGAAAWWVFKPPSQESPVVSAPDQRPADVAPTTTDKHMVVSGDLYIHGRSVAGVQVGQPFRIGNNRPAVIRIADGSQITLDPACQAVFHSDDRNHRVVELIEGGGTFQVVKGARRFQVKTSIGDVNVLGTEFSVKLLPSNKGNEGMKKSTMMAVAVMAGVVQVQVGAESVTLRTGENRVFAKALADKMQETTGKFAKFSFTSEDASAGTLVVAASDKNTSVKFECNKSTQIFVNQLWDDGTTRQVKTTLVALSRKAKKGQVVTVTHNGKDMKALRVVLK